MDWDKIGAELRKPLDSRHVKPPKQYGPKGDYIEGWHAIAEANRIFGEGGWSYAIAALTCVSERDREIGQAKKPGFGVTYTARVVIMVDGVQRDDVGAGHGYDVDCGLAHESAIKEAVTDALKRALRTFGNPFGLALYDKTREGVADTATIERDAKAGTDAQAAIMEIEACETIGALKAFFTALPRHIAARAEVVAAKDRRKAEIEADDLPGVKSGADHMSAG